MASAAVPFVLRVSPKASPVPNSATLPKLLPPCAWKPVAAGLAQDRAPLVDETRKLPAVLAPALGHVMLYGAATVAGACKVILPVDPPMRVIEPPAPGRPSASRPPRIASEPANAASCAPEIVRASVLFVLSTR